MSKNLRNQVYFTVNSLSINNITINAPQNITYTWTLPNTVGSSGEFLTTDGTGVLSWTSTPIVSGTLTVGGLIDNSLTINQAVFTDASKKLISVGTTGSGVVALAVSPTFTSSINTTPAINASNTSATSPAHLGEFYAANLANGSSTHFQVGKSSTVSEHVNIQYRHAATNATKRATFKMNASEFSMFGDGLVASTLNTPLTVTGNVNATTFTSTQTSGSPPFTVASTTNVANLNASFLNGATFASPGAIGSTTASTIAATTISASGAITSTVATSNPPFVVASTTNVPNLNASSLNGATFASPGSIGSTTPSTIAATTITASSTITADSFNTTTGSFTTSSAVSIPLPASGLITLKLSFVVSLDNSSVTISGNTLLGGGGTNLPVTEPQEIFTTSTGVNTVTFEGVIVRTTSQQTTCYVSLDFDLSRRGSLPRLPFCSTGVYTTSAVGTTKISSSGYLPTTALSVTLTPTAGTMTGVWGIIKY